MNKAIKGLVIGAVLAATSQALDLRVTAGAMVPDNESLEKQALVGLEIANYTNKKGKGLAYGFKFGVVSTDFKADEGAYVNLNGEIVYKISRKYEPYVTFGGVYQTLKDSDYGYGYNYGAGMRYSSCRGFQIGAEFVRQDMTYKSEQIATALLDESKYINHNLALYVGYRF